MKFSPFTTLEQHSCLPILLNYLNQNPPDERHFWGDWTIERILGGQNNLLYRATHSCGDVAVKITRVDERNRAVREFNTLLALQQADLQIAPIPIALECEKVHGRQIVVQSWLNGEVSASPPQTDNEWALFLEHILLTHTILPERTAVTLPPATLYAPHPSQFFDYLKQVVSRLPAQARLEPLQELLARLEARHYGEHCDDNTAVSRIWAYYPLIVTFWVAIFSKGMYDLQHDIPHDRLAARPSDWAKTLPIKYNHYLNLAHSLITDYRLPVTGYRKRRVI